MKQIPVQEGASGWSTQGAADAEHAVLVKSVAALRVVKSLTVLQAQAHLPLFQAQPQTTG